MDAPCWLAHGDRVSTFTGEAINLYEVCKRFKLDESSTIYICDFIVEKANDGTWAVPVATLRSIGRSDQDGTACATAFRVEASWDIYIRLGSKCLKFEIHGFINLREVCSQFELDPDARLTLSGTSMNAATCSPFTISTATQDGKSPASAFVIDGISLKKELPRIAKRFKDAYYVSQPSSETKDLKSFTRCMDRKYFNDMRAGLGMPIRLAAKAFGNFADNMQKCYTFKIWELQFAAELISGMTKVYDKESDRRIVFGNLLKRYLGDNFKVVDNHEAKKRLAKREGSSDDHGHHQKTPDIQVEKVLDGGRCVKLCTIEVKPEMGMNGEGLTEALFYYTVDAAHNYVHDRYTGSPQILIELIGPNIRIGGAVYTDKATYEPLADFLSLLPFREISEFHRVATLVIALKKALRDLAALYAAAPVIEPHDEPEKDITLWPYPIKETYPINSCVRVCRHGRQVFYVNEVRVIKFVQRYGTAAHDQWKALGYAPDYTVSYYPAGWMMIDMECLLPAQGWHLLFDLRRSFLSKGDAQGWEKIKATALDTLKMLQEQQPRMVHGDMRLNNIMYNQTSEKVCFLDFDWAGEERTVRYPPVLNIAIDWPEGVNANGLILPSHDMELLEAELTLAESEW